MGLWDSVIPGLQDFSFFLSNTFVYEPILLKLFMNANIVKMQIFHKIKSDLRGHSRSQIMTFLIKNWPFLLFMLLLIDWLNAADHYEITKFDLYKDDTCLFFTSTYVLMDNFLSLFFSLSPYLTTFLASLYLFLSSDQFNFNSV